MSVIHIVLPTVLAASAAATQPVPEQTLPAPRATYIVALYERGPAWAQGVPPLQQGGIEEHAAYMDRLFAEGKLPLGGPLLADLDALELSGALLVIEADSLEAARELVMADPALKVGLLRLKELRHFLVYIGGVAGSDSSSSQS